MVAVDSNVLVRFIVNDDPVLSRKAQEIIEGAQPASLLLDRIIFAETGYVLGSVYRYGRDKIAKIYQSMLGDPAFFVLDRELIDNTVRLFSDYTQLSFEDCWLLALKRAGNVKDVATFDQALKKRL